jgi:hypothetical protein
MLVVRFPGPKLLAIRLTLLLADLDKRGDVLVQFGDLSAV